MQLKLLDNHFLIRATLNSISQIILIENTIVGAIFLVGLGLSSLTSLFAVLLGASVGSIMGKYCFQESPKVSQGLYGYNAALSALAITVFSNTPFWLFYAFLSAGMTTYFQHFLTPWFEKRKLPLFTFPFVVISWGWILFFHHLHGNAEITAPVFQIQGSIQEVLYILTLPFHQIFFGGNPASGGLIMLGILLAGRELFFKALCCTLFCGGIWYLLGTEISFFHQGLFGFNAVLVGVALASFLPSSRFWKIMPFASVLCVWLQIVITEFLNHWQFSALTFPFVLTTWLVLWANKSK